MKIGRLHLGRSNSPRNASRGASSSLSETIALLRRYVVQEAVGPIKHLGRVLALGLAGAFAFGIGGLFIVVGALRLIQAESGSAFAGNWSFAPYLFSAVVGIALIGGFAALTLRSINGSRRAETSNREER